MRTLIKSTIALVAAVCAILMPSCSTSEAKYEYLTKDIPAIFAAVDVLGAPTITPDKFFEYVNENFDRSYSREEGDGIVILYEWRKDAEYTLSKGEDYYCNAMFDYSNDPYNLTISSAGFMYKSPSTDDADKFYSIATGKLEPLMTKWGFKLNQELTTPTCKYYLKGNDFITVSKEGNEITIIKSFH